MTASRLPALRPALSAALLLAALLVAPGTARADGPCDDHAYGLPSGPVTSGLLDGDLGRAHRVCGRSEIGLDAGGKLLIDLPFFGYLSAGVRLDGSWAWGPRGELFGSFEVLRYDSLIAPLASSSLGIGHTTVGAAYRFLDRPAVSLGVNGKLVLPTAAPLYRNAWPIGIDAGLAAQFRVHPKVQFHAQAAAVHSFALGKGPGQPRIGAAVTAGTELRPDPTFAVVIDLYGSFGYTAPLDVFAAALALRFSDGKRFGFNVGATIPIVGRERSQVRFDLGATVRFGPITPAELKRPKKAGAGDTASVL